MAILRWSSGSSASSKMEGRFEEEEAALFSFSEAPIRIAVYKCTWMALNTVMYGGFAFWTIFLLFQIMPPFRLTLDNLRTSPSGEWGLLKHSLLLGTELGLLAMVAFMTFLVPTLIMTWITALVFQYLFGRGFFGRDKGLVQEGSLIAKDITWMAVKSVVKKGNVAAVVVLFVALALSGLNGGNERQETGVSAG